MQINEQINLKIEIITIIVIEVLVELLHWQKANELQH